MKTIIIRNGFLIAVSLVSAILLFFYLSLNFHESISQIQFLKLRTRKPYVCLRKGRNWAIITSINYPTDSIRIISQLSDWIIMIVADTKTPKDWFKNDSFLLTKRLKFILLTLEQQMQLDFDLVDVIPNGNYARKNIGYLCAIQCGAKVIYDTDDDNKLIDGSNLKIIPEHEWSSIIEAVPPVLATKPWVNPYALYGHPEIWPRGFPLRAINETDTYEFFNVRKALTSVRPWIQQGLAGLDPDVDAIYRLVHPRSIGNVEFRAYPKAIAIGSGFYSPYNSQNTLYMKEAFWGLLIPFSVSSRVCDIWRGYWAQRLLWDVGGCVVFRPASVKHIRNAHDYMKDLNEELDLYLKAEKLIDFLSTWQSLKLDVFERMAEVSRQMANNGFWDESEIRLMNAWIKDLKRVGYRPPSIKSLEKSVARRSAGRTAICVTGQLDRISEAWPTTEKSLNLFFGNRAKEYDLFYYVSTYNSKDEADEEYLKTQIRPAAGIIYDDPPLSPLTATDSFIIRFPLSLKNLFNQLFGLKRCFEMVQKYSAENGAIYDFMMRLRTDYVIDILNESLLNNVWNAVEFKNQLFIPSGDDWAGTNDRMAFGPIDCMKHYMMRYDEMNIKGLSNFHSEKFLLFILNFHKVNVTRFPWAYHEVPES